MGYHVFAVVYGADGPAKELGRLADGEVLVGDDVGGVDFAHLSRHEGEELFGNGPCGAAVDGYKSFGHGGVLFDACYMEIGPLEPGLEGAPGLCAYGCDGGFDGVDAAGRIGVCLPNVECFEDGHYGFFFGGSDEWCFHI